MIMGHINLARILRKNMTKQERILWKLLRNSNLNNYKFRRQHPIGDYIVDFVCMEKFLIIEVDGGQHNQKVNIENDKKRTEYFEKRGFNVVRFWNSDIDLNIDGVYKELLKYLK